MLQSMEFQRVRHHWVTELTDCLRITVDGDCNHEIRRCLLLRRKPIANLVNVKVKFTQSCLTLCDPMDYTVHGILQARILEWVAFPFSRGFFQPGVEPRSPTLQADSLPAELSQCIKKQRHHFADKSPSSQSYGFSSSHVQM